MHLHSIDYSISAIRYIAARMTPGWPVVTSPRIRQALLRF